MKKCLVTGNIGFIGSALSRELESNGWDVYGYDKAIDKPQVLFQLFNEHKFDVIFHLAAHVKNTNDISHTENIEITRDILTHISNDTRLVFASTVNVYSGEVDNKYIHHEECKPSPRTTYEVSKLMCEKMIIGNHSNHIVLRLANVYGPGVPHGVIHDWLQKEEVTINVERPSARCFVHVNDVVSAFISASEWEPNESFDGNRAFNVCGPIKDSYLDLVDIAKIMGLKVNETESGGKQTIYRPSYTKIRYQMGWSPFDTNPRIDFKMMKDDWNKKQ